MTLTQTAPIDADRLNEFLGRFVGDLGATVAAGSVMVGDRLGLYKALAVVPQLPHELASSTGTDTRYVTEWLRGQAAGGYVTYDQATERYSLTAEQAFALTDPDGAVYVPGAFQLALGHPAGAAACRSTHSAPAPASAGTSRTRRSSSDASASSVPGTPRTSSTSGFPLWRGWWRVCSPVSGWPTSAVASAPRRS